MMWLFEDLLLLASKRITGERYSIIAQMGIPEIKEFADNGRIPDTPYSLLRVTNVQGSSWNVHVDFLQIYQWVSQFQTLKSKYAKEFVSSQTNMVQDLAAERIPLYYVEIQVLFCFVLFCFV